MARHDEEHEDRQPAGEGGAGSEPAGAGRRAQRRAFRRDEILKTALLLVEEGGLDAVTTTALARRTGAALGALYRFFPSKAAVVAALQREALAGLHVELAQASTAAATRAQPLGARVQAIAALIAIADVVFAEPQAHPARFRLVDEALSRLEAVHEDADAAALEANLGSLLALAHERVTAFAGAVPDEDDDERRGDRERFSFALWAALHGVTHFRKRDRLVPAAHASARVATTTVCLLLRGLGADDAELAAAWAAVSPRALGPLVTRRRPEKETPRW